MTADWPRERRLAAARAVMKAVPEDFQVVELAAAGPDGAGEHLYLRLEKTSLSTPQVTRWLAETYQVPEVAVGYAGMKDKHAVTEQWFSVHTPLDADVLPERAGVRLCDASRHRQKLRRGRLLGNRFRVRLRNVVGDGWAARLAAVRDSGVPNYFGPQRFGGDNLVRAQAWLGQRRRRREGAFRTGLYLSVLRSFLFNEVLAMRVRSGNWDRLLPGDVAVPLPSCRAAHAACAGRQVPSGPLWGRGRSAAGGEALALERAALAAHDVVCDGLEHAGLTQQRRSLVLQASDLDWHAENGDVELTFALPPGAYATILLAEVFDLASPEMPA
jgi:tRNA pseudouridine13 synthase